MFQRFTDRARRVLVLAQEEGRELNHAQIGTEHILLGLIREGDGVAAKALDAMGVTYDAVRQKVEEASSLVADASTGAQPFTPRAKKVLELALREAMQLGHSYVGTEHVLLAIVREGSGVATRVLLDLGVELSQVREIVLATLSSQRKRESESTPTQVHFGSTMLRGVVRSVGQQLRPDIDANALDSRATEIADELFEQLRSRWSES